MDMVKCLRVWSAFAPYSPVIRPLLAGRSDSAVGFGGRIGHAAFVCMCMCSRVCYCTALLLYQQREALYVVFPTCSSSQFNATRLCLF